MDGFEETFPPLLEDDEADVAEEERASRNKRPLWLRIFQGGTQVDAFMMEASQQVGQSLLSLPWSFSLMGYAGGVASMLFLSVTSMWTQFLLISLMTEYQHVVATDKSHPRHGDKEYVASYHDVMWSLKGEPLGRPLSSIVRRLKKLRLTQKHTTLDVLCEGKFWGRLSLLVVFFALLGLTVAQIVATASNLYMLTDALPKRTHSLITGAVFSLLCFVPNFRDYRLIAFVGVVSTFYTACFLTAAAAARGPSEDVEYGAPTTTYGFFLAFTNLLFMFGGHTAAVEKAVVMDKPGMYDRAYAMATAYVYTITLPSGITGYHTFGIEAQGKANAFYLFEPSVARNVGLALMCIHEFVAFGLFAGPLFHIWEKILKVKSVVCSNALLLSPETHDVPHNIPRRLPQIDHKGYWLRSASRFVVVGLALLVAVAMPFFGVINAVLGAFTTTFGSYIIPAVVYNLHFGSEEKIANKRRDIPFGLSMSTVKALNWILVVLIAILGVGLGGWSSVKKLSEEVHKFHFFPECYGC
ncbi:hypothetical protein ACHAWF_005513 [Thalassiosira exigua]